VESWEEESGMETILPPPRTKLVQDSEGNEENGYSVPDPNKTKIDYPKEPKKANKNTLKEKIL
jgi:hypothetical protein